LVDTAWTDNLRGVVDDGVDDHGVRISTCDGRDAEVVAVAIMDANRYTEHDGVVAAEDVARLVGRFGHVCDWRTG
jgi:hypothetical protein